MHFDWHFTAVQILWTLTFAAQLVLMVVLLGRDRARRFPWFTASIVAMALRLLCERELFQRLPQLTFVTVLIILADVITILGLLVVVELARKAFAGARRTEVIVNVVGLLLVAASIISMWGAWPAWKTLTADSRMATAQVLQFFAQKTELLVDLLNIELGLMVVIFGRKFNAPWKSHTQRIAIGLSTVSIGSLAVQAILQFVAKSANPHTQAELQPILDLRDRLFNASHALYIAVLVWWIVCLWIDEPGPGATARPSAPPPPPDVPAEAEALAEPTPDEAEPEVLGEPEGEPETPDAPAPG
jgi:hypothetical protein